ncbi:MAG: aminotransferase class V-fold PLP-dependent enzyme, partial [Caldilineaceae bacterium]|nr:aminotransferase class V-fold PLP-dependent enzyme [Caldilineaceae bacterium]
MLQETKTPLSAEDDCPFGYFDRTTQAAALNEAQAEFLRKYPSYAQTQVLDDLRMREFARLDRQGHVYLDYTGGGLYAERQLAQHMQMLQEGVFGNPHSHNPTSLAMTELVEATRAYVLSYFNADLAEYVAIFTANASGALKLVAESYPFEAGSTYVLTADNHNSVNGVREFARAHKAKVVYLPATRPEMRLDEATVQAALEDVDPQKPNLFAYPAQSNYTGVQHGLAWIEKAQALGWDVFLDAAAFAPTNRLDLSQVHPDFVSLSFYKIFGYPTGIGCLLARRTALAKLHRPWFAGGTVAIASVQGDGHFLAEGEAAFEDGTVNYLMIPAVEIGLRFIEEIGIDTIHQRVMCLTEWLLQALTSLRHSSGQQLARIYGPLTADRRGGTITMNFVDANGEVFDVERIEELANVLNISLRTGCFCNPGA